MILSVVVYYLRRLDHLFWRILCQIRIIKYCAEPSVRESPKHEGSLQRRAKFTELLRISPASPEHYPGIPAIHNSSNQTARATCHALIWRQRYCQTRYTRRYRFIPPSLQHRGCTAIIGRSAAITRWINHQPIARQQTYECTYKQPCELHHDLSRVWGLIPREWYTCSCRYLRRRRYPIHGVKSWTYIHAT